MKKIRDILSSKLFIHGLVILGFLALWGYIETNNEYIIFGILASFSGAVCGSFIRVIDAIRNHSKK